MTVVIYSEVQRTIEEEGYAYVIGEGLGIGAEVVLADSALRGVKGLTGDSKITSLEETVGESTLSNVEKQEAITSTNDIYKQIKEASLTQTPKKQIYLELVGIIEDSFTEEQLEQLVNMPTYYYESDPMVLGKYNWEGNSYILDAIESESTYFSIGDEIWNAIEEAGMPKSEVWRLNREVPDRAIADGKEIKFSHNLELYLTDDSYFEMEVDYLKGKDFEFVEIGGEWYATT